MEKKIKIQDQSIETNNSVANNNGIVNNVTNIYQDRGGNQSSKTNEPKKNFWKEFRDIILFIIAIMTLLFGGGIYWKFCNHNDIGSSPKREQEEQKSEKKDTPAEISSQDSTAKTPTESGTQKKQGNVVPPTEIKHENVYITGQAYALKDSILAWERAEKDAVNKLLEHTKLKNYDMSAISHEIDSAQSFSKHRNPPDDGIYDAKVVIFVNTNNTKH